MATIAEITEIPESDLLRDKLVAPLWHTVLLVSLFLALTFGGTFFQREARSQPEKLPEHAQVLQLYVSLIAMEWGLFVSVWKGLRRNGANVRTLIGGRWRGPKDIALDAGLAVGLWTVWTILEKGLDRGFSHWFAPADAAAIQTLLPRRWDEILLWTAVAASAGFCEELVFRGYFQRQFEAFTRSTWIALILQAALFGISHGYQGAEACVKIAIYGALFGLLALWRRSLRPGMIAHAGTDILSGIFGI